MHSCALLFNVAYVVQSAVLWMVVPLAQFISGDAKMTIKLGSRDIDSICVSIVPSSNVAAPSHLGSHDASQDASPRKAKPIRP